MQKITPFLWFNTEAEEAMTFYTTIFSTRPGQANGESKIISIKRYPDGPLDGPMKGMEGKVLTGAFMLDGQNFLCLDGGPVFKPTGAMSLHVECEDQAEVDHFWSKLGEGADPNAQQCGWIQDKYGFSWQIIPKALPQLLSNPDKAKADRALAAMMKMKKIEIAELESAANNTAQ
jgi:predicted 3-demethylubiquinone-9 3-methyltransferase (glyoxalase superfamily)